MSQENVELLRPVYEEWERGNLRAGAELLDPEVESVWPREFPSGGTYRGLKGHGDAMREWLSPWEDFRLIAEGFYEADNRVVVPFRVRGRGKESGVEVERRWAHIWTLRGDKAVRFEVYLDPAEALAAVGLSERDAHSDF
jgi:ketosteroid isomerase-like protein